MSKRGVHIIKPGFYSTIQDNGRRGYEHLGVPVSGAMDMIAYRRGNQLLNNHQDAASIEYTLVGPTVTFLQDTYFVLTGADTEAYLDGISLQCGKVTLARVHQQVIIKAIKKGARGYLSIAGGFNSELVFGSRSMYKGITSQAVIEQDSQIEVGMSNYGTAKGASIHLETLTLDNTITVYPGPEFELLTPEIQDEIAQSLFTISSNWNRMSITLKETIAQELPSILTGPVAPGIIQLTPEGELIILMRDAQVTGGYPRVLQVNEIGLNTLAQNKQGDTLRLHLERTAMV